MVGPVLVVDDNADVLHAARLALAPHVERIELRNSPESLEDTVRSDRYDVVVLDMNFVAGEHQGVEGLNQLARIRAADQTVSVVLITAFGGVALAVDALKQGAADFLLKPWRNEKLVSAVIAAADRTRALRRDALQLERLERDAIHRALGQAGNNIAHAAKSLGVSRQALYRKMARHGL